MAKQEMLSMRNKKDYFSLNVRGPDTKSLGPAPFF